VRLRGPSWRPVLTSCGRAHAPKRPRLYRSTALHPPRSFRVSRVCHTSQDLSLRFSETPPRLPCVSPRRASGGPHSLGCPQNRPQGSKRAVACLAERTYASSTPTMCSARRPHHCPLWLAIALVPRTKRPGNMLPKDHGIGVLHQPLKQDRERCMLL
jgi:hypothetical protein